MPAKEIKELRQSGKLDEAYSMALAELQAEPDNIWTKRNISWVYYDLLKLNNTVEQFNSFRSYLNEIKDLQLNADEKMFLDKLCWQIGKMVFNLLKAEPVDERKIINLYEATEPFNLPKPSEGFSFLFKAFHKSFKDSDRYLQFADWWNFENFMPEDFQKEKMSNGKEIMAVAEQAYISYAKHLLPKKNISGEISFIKENAKSFLITLSKIENDYPSYQYLPYFHAKLLLSLGERDNMLKELLPFAKKKRNDFWVWEILSEAFSNDQDKVLACYCKALLCNSPEEMLVSLRQKLAGILISKVLYDEARTEIDILVKVRNAHGFKIPYEITNWQVQDWYKNATSKDSNVSFYKPYKSIAESLLFSDVPEHYAVVEFVNSEKKILNFITSESKFGFFKYDRYFKNVKIGEVLKVRFQTGSKNGIYQVYTAEKVNDNEVKNQFVRDVEGDIRIPEGKSFGFLEDIFIHPSLVNKMNLKSGDHIKGKAIKSYNQDKNQFGWKLYQIG